MTVGRLSTTVTIETVSCRAPLTSRGMFLGVGADAASIAAKLPLVVITTRLASLWD